VTTDQNADRLPVRTADPGPLVQFDRHGFPLLPLPEPDWTADSTGAEQHVHIHHHYAPEAPAQQAVPAASDAGWLLLNRLVPYLITAALVVFLVGGILGILAWAFTAIMAFLVVLVHSLVALTVTAVVALGGVALLAGVLRPLFTGPSITVQGSKNRIDSAAMSRNGAK
jgi:hypothetical protein